MDHYELFVEIELRDLQIYQLRHTQSAAVERLHDCAVTLALGFLHVDRPDHGVDLIHSQDFRKMASQGRAFEQQGRVAVEIAFKLHESEKRFYAGYDSGLRSGRDSEVEKICGKGSQSIGRDLAQSDFLGFEVSDELAHISDVSLARIVAQPALKNQIGLVSVDDGRY